MNQGPFEIDNQLRDCRIEKKLADFYIYLTGIDSQNTHTHIRKTQKRGNKPGKHNTQYKRGRLCHIHYLCLYIRICGDQDCSQMTSDRRYFDASGKLQIFNGNKLNGAVF